VSRSIYVAAASAEIDLAERCMAELRRHGWRITADWCAEMRNAGPDHGLPHWRQQHHTRADLAGVAEADVLWLLSAAPGTETRGAWVELGYALRGNGRIVVSGEQSLFTSLAHERFETHEEALARLCLGPARVAAE
jgi:hypothetical protein